MQGAALCYEIVGETPDLVSLAVVVNICRRIQDVWQRAEFFWKLERSGLVGNFVGFAFKNIANSDYDVFIQMVSGNQISIETVLDALSQNFIE